MNIGSYKSKADENKQKREYYERLKLRMENNKRTEEALRKAYHNREIGIVPTVQKSYKSSAEEANDIFNQRRIGLENLVTILPYGNEAEQALHTLSTRIHQDTGLNEISLFNRHFQDFKKELKGTTNITPKFFEELWKQYKLKLAHTMHTNINIPLNKTMFDENLEQLGNKIRNSITRHYVMSIQNNRELKETIEKAIQDRDQAKLEKLAKAVEEGNEKVIQEIISHKYDELSQVHLNSLTLPKLKSIFTKTTGISTNPNVLEEYFGKPIDDINEDDFIKEIIAYSKPDYLDTREKYPFYGLPTGYYNETQLSRYNIKELKQILADITGQRNTPSTFEKIFSKPLSDIKQRDYINEILAQYIESSRGTHADSATSKKPKSSGKKVVKGRGIGISPALERKYINFGRYLLHYPSLKKSKLNLKYPSKGYLEPSKEISHELKNLIIYVIDNNKVDFGMYDSLPEKEKAFFNKICHRACIDSTLGMKYNGDADKEDKKKRFNIVVGEIQAGNDNASLREELKNFIIEFMDDNTISHKKGFEILQELKAI